PAVRGDGLHQVLAVTEVVLDRDVVLLSGCGTDVLQRHGFDAAFGEEALGGEEDDLARCVTANVRRAHRWMLPSGRQESTVNWLSSMRTPSGSARKTMSTRAPSRSRCVRVSSSTRAPRPT